MRAGSARHDVGKDLEHARTKERDFHRGCKRRTPLLPKKGSCNSIEKLDFTQLLSRVLSGSLCLFINCQKIHRLSNHESLGCSLRSSTFRRRFQMGASVARCSADACSWCWGSPRASDHYSKQESFGMAKRVVNELQGFATTTPWCQQIATTRANMQVLFLFKMVIRVVIILGGTLVVLAVLRRSVQRGCRH